MKWQLSVCWLSLMLFASVLLAQRAGFPHPLTSAEEAAFPAFQRLESTEIAHIGPAPPPVSVRTMAEWEEVQALILSWTDYPEVLTEIVRYAVDECDVFILTPDELATQVALSLAGVSLERVQLLPISFNSIWMRDYGPWAVYHEFVDSLAISDYRYNRPDRPEDDLVPHELADHLGLPLYHADDTPYRWIHAGGNFLRDGLGTAWSSDLVLKENTGKTGMALAEYARLFFGVQDYRILPRLPFDIIHHLDMHMRILDEETIAVNQYPPGLADGPQIEANLRWLRQHYRTPYGHPYQILRLPVPPQRGQYPPASDYLTYSNALFVNKTLLVPVYGHSLDSVALQIYRDYLPGYRVVGIDCSTIIEAVGALHCVAKVVGTPDPLYIAHARLRDSYLTGEPLLVEASAYHQSGVAAVNLYYRTDATASYQLLPMTATGNATWRAIIPAPQSATVVQYYLEARANNGKVQYRPLPAPDGYYHFRVRPFTRPPQAAWGQSLTYLAPGMTLQLFADAEGGATAYEWTLDGASPSSADTDEVAVSYAAAGQYPIQLRLGNPIGEDEQLQEAAVRVLPSRGLFLDTFTEEGETAYWQVDNAAAPTTGWIWTDSEYCFGGHWQLRHQQATAPLERAFLRTALDLRNLESATLQFSVAYAAHPESYRRMDELRVWLTTAAGEVLNVYNKGGQALTTREPQEAPYDVRNCTEWRRETIDLRPWLGQQVVLAFESVGGQGNTLYLDDIQLSRNAVPELLILEPAPDTLIRAAADQPQPLLIAIEAFDTDGVVDVVDIYVNDTLVESLLTPPYLWEYTMPAFGRYCIRARARDGEGATNWSQTHCVEYAAEPVGVQTLRYQSYGRIIPNPVRDQLTFRWTHSELIPQASVDLLDARGRSVRQTHWTLSPGELQQLAMGELPAGLYQLQLQYKGERLWQGAVLKID